MIGTRMGAGTGQLQAPPGTVLPGDQLRVVMHYDGPPLYWYVGPTGAQQAQFTLTTLVINTLKPVDQQYVALSCDTDGAYTAGYRFGFNGQQKDDEIAGKGNHNTAQFWEYDTRLGRRWNRDPVVKPYRSSYDVFDNSPVYRVDLLGDDDYYNYAGQWIGSDGIGTKMRVVRNSMLTKEAFAKSFEALGLENIKEKGREIKMPSDEQIKTVFADVYNKSVADGVERKAYFTFDPDNAEISISAQPRDPDDDEHSSVNNFNTSGITDPETKQKFSVKLDPIHKGEGWRVIFGQIHGHPSKPSRESAPGRSTVNTEGAVVGTSREDGVSAKVLGVPVHAADYTGKIQRVTPTGAKTTMEPSQQVIRESFEISGNKPKN